LPVLSRAARGCRSIRVPRASISVEQLIADTNAVATHLSERFGVASVYLLGHSWGSLVGLGRTGWLGGVALSRSCVLRVALRGPDVNLHALHRSGASIVITEAVVAHAGRDTREEKQ
jgi:pimeloyl-ACP methyl ester carboxylesterase